jgi:hypothetical protein
MHKNPWQHLFHNLKQQNLSLSDKQRTQFSRAHARLRIAKRFKGISLIDVSDATERGYSTGMAIFLAYSGMEALAAAMREQVHEWKMNDQKLALRLSKLLSGVDLSHPDPQEAISWLLDGGNLIQQLKDFKDGNNHNVLLIARSLRHMVAHGSFTTHGLKMFTKRECDGVEELRQLIFNVCDERLEKWLDEQLLNQASTPTHQRNGGDGHHFSGAEASPGAQAGKCGQN